MKKTIRVTGMGKISVPPDRIRLILKLEALMDTYKDAVNASQQSVSELKGLFQELGFDQKDLKTESFKIDTVFERELNKKKLWEKRFKGYEYTHMLKIEFGVDNKLLGKVVNRLSKCKFYPEFKIIYTVKDPEEVKNLLLDKAVKDSFVKAEVLSKAAGVQLGEIISIDYSWGEIEFTNAPFGKFLDTMRLSDSEDDSCYYGDTLDITPEDITASDTVTIVWGLEVKE